jgi:5-(aminomethyl)-3-furanmethanol phosphate kinase
MNLPNPVVVVKVGGSLLDWPGLPGRLFSFLFTNPWVASDPLPPPRSPGWVFHPDGSQAVCPGTLCPPPPSAGEGRGGGPGERLPFERPPTLSLPRRGGPEKTHPNEPPPRERARVGDREDSLRRLFPPPQPSPTRGEGGRVTDSGRERSGGHRPSRPLLIVGGGRAADVIRDLDRCHELGEEEAHALALRSLDLTAHVLAALLDAAGREGERAGVEADRFGFEVVEDRPSIESSWAAGRLPILAPRRFLDEDDRRSPDPLPHRWSVTTDSIAARVATLLGATELVLLKSAPLPPGTDRAGAAELGLVDPAFPGASRGLTRVVYLNLRDPSAALSALE